MGKSLIFYESSIIYSPRKEPNIFTVVGDIAVIDLRGNSGQLIAQTITNKGLLPYLLKRKWCFDGHGYAISQYPCFIQMHRLIKETNLEVDHINGNSLDNRVENLRVVTHQQNVWNIRKIPKNKSGYRGVSYLSRKRKWQATICHKGKTVFLGYFDDKESAARAYDLKAISLRGEFAILNFPNNHQGGYLHG